MGKIIYEKVEFDLKEEWIIKNNSLLKIEIESIKDFNKDFNKDIWSEFSEDILNIVNISKSIMIDVGWYPKFDTKGHFGLVVIESNEWRKPIETLVTRNTKKLIDKVNEIIYRY